MLQKNRGESEILKTKKTYKIRSWEFPRGHFKKSGVNICGKHHGLHSMRHSLATNLLGEDTAVNEIASILGHSSIKSTKPYIWSDIKHLKMCALEVDSYGC